MSALKHLTIAVVFLALSSNVYAADLRDSIQKRGLDSRPAREAVSTKPMRAGNRMSIMKMLRELKPRTIPLSTSAAARNVKINGVTPEPPKYETADCTGSDGIDKACCFWKPGMGGSTCDTFLALCNSHDGWSGNGNSGGATCTGQGTVE